MNAEFSNPGQENSQYIDGSSMVQNNAQEHNRSGLNAENELVEQEMDRHIEQIAVQYHFDDVKTRWIYSEGTHEMVQNNKVFLAMLDEYVTESGYKLRDSNPKNKLNVLDFGSGIMPYMNGYEAFFLRYGTPENNPRIDLTSHQWTKTR